MTEQLDLKAIREYVERATAGPWSPGGPYPSVSVIICIDAGSGWPNPEPPIYEPICYLHQAGPDDFTSPPPQQAVANAEFIARIRTDAVALLDLAERQAKQLAEANGIINSLLEYDDDLDTPDHLDVIEEAMKFLERIP